MKYIRFFQPVAVHLLVIIVFSSCLSAQDKSAEMDKLMQQYYDAGQFNGTVLVAEKGKVILKKGYGLANMEWDIPNEPDTKMRLGSITKQFTSMLIMQLVEEGKIDLQAPMTTYLPSYRKETGDQITIHHLLTHSSGIPSYTSKPGFFNEVSRDPYEVDEFVEKYCSGDLEFEPGSQFLYNNSGYFLLGAIIEEVSGMGYEEALQKRIFRPLGMLNSGYDRHSPIIKKRATGYSRSAGGYVNAPYLDMGLPFAAGSLYSTVEDLHIWDRALYTEKLLSVPFKKIMFTPHLNNYAYGWGVGYIPTGDSGDSLTLIAHGGGINGFNTLISRIVDNQQVIVLLNNTGGTDLNSMSRGLKNILYGEPYDLPKKPIGEELYEKLGSEDLKATIAYYEDLRSSQVEKYDFGESELNNLGYALISEERLDEAIAIFQLNIKVYPGSSNVYDSLGEAYMIKGQKKNAIKNYERSLELDPENSNAVEMLEKLKE